MTRSLAAAIVAGLLLAGSGPGFAAKRTSSTKTAVKSQSQATQSGGSQIRSDSRDSHPYGRDHDPYARGVNWPKAN